MINVSSAFLAENEKLVASPQGKLSIEGLSDEITSEDYLQSFTVERYDNENGKLIGNAISRKITAEFMNNGYQKSDFANKKITAYTGYNGEYVNFTPCYVSEAVYDKVADIWTLTAYDVLGEFNKYTVDAFYKEYPDINFATETLRSFALKIIVFVNTQSEYDIALSDESFFNSDLVLGVQPNFGGSENLRTVLMQIAECGFCNCIVNRSGLVEFRPAFKSSSVMAISPAIYFELSHGDSFGIVNSLVLKRLPYNDNVYASDEESIEVNGLCELSIADNAFLDDKRSTVAIKMLDHVKGYSYISSYYLDWKGCAALDTSDLITIKGLDASLSDIVTMFYGETFTYDGSIASVSEFVIPEDSQTDYSSAQNAMLYDRLKKAEIKVDKVENEITSLVSETLPIVKKSYIVDLSANMYAINVASNNIPVISGSFEVEVSVRLGDTDINSFDVSAGGTPPGISVNIDNDKITFTWDSTTAIDDVSTYTITVEITDSDGSSTLIMKEVSLIAVQNGEVPYIEDGTWHIGGEDTGVLANWSEEIGGLRGYMSQQYTAITQDAEQLALNAVKEYAGTDENGNLIGLSESVTQMIKENEMIIEYKNTVDMLGPDIADRFKNLKTYLRYGPLNETGTEVGIEMGTSNDEVKVRLINDKLVFYAGKFISADADNVIQSIDAKTKASKIGNTLQYGDEWEHGVDSEGNFYHAYIGN